MDPVPRILATRGVLIMDALHIVEIMESRYVSMVIQEWFTHIPPVQLKFHLKPIIYWMLSLLR